MGTKGMVRKNVIVYGYRPVLHLYPVTVMESPYVYFLKSLFGSRYEIAEAILLARMRGEGVYRIPRLVGCQVQDVKAVLGRAIAIGLLRKHGRATVFSRSFEDRLKKLEEGYYGLKHRLLQV